MGGRAQCGGMRLFCVRRTGFPRPKSKGKTGHKSQMNQSPSHSFIHVNKKGRLTTTDSVVMRGTHSHANAGWTVRVLDIEIGR